MKRHLFLVLFLITVFIAVFSFVPVKQAERFYYAFEEKIPLETVEGWYVISYDSTLDTIAESARLAARHDILSLSWKNNRTTILQLGKETVLATVEEELLETSNAYTIQPLYRLASGLEMPVTDELVIGLPDGSIEEVSMLHKRFAVTVLETNEVFQLLRVPKGADALEIANHYQESGFVEFSHPNLLTFSQSFQAIPNDPYFNNQFYLRNTGQVFNPVENHAGTPGADISILGAWDVTMGENTVVVAVLDDGVTANHPDLPNARQVRLNGSNFGAGNANDPSPTGQDSHGNACAGIIAATRNNGEGIAGIAPNVRIMPVRTRNATPANVAAAILFAVNNGTHILSCS